MPAQALYLKWRPRTFDDVIGQGHITQTLRNSLIQDRVRHAYLFNGPRGTGKTTMARILAKAVNCLHPDPALRPCDECAHCRAINEGRFLDLIEIDAASHNGVDDVRDLRDKIAFAPSEGRYKVYIVDEVHRFSPAAFDALLKTLEEPPEHAIFILATTEFDKVPPTIKSRSLTFEFRRVSASDVAERLARIADEEGVIVDHAALELVAMQGTGSVRDSISLLDQLIADPSQPITLDYAERLLGTAGARLVGHLVQAIIDQDPATGLDVLNRAIEDGADPGQFGRQIVEYLRNLLLVQTGGPSLVQANDEMRAVLGQQAGQISRAALIRAVRAFNTANGEIKGGWQPQLPLELALIESARPVQPEPVAELPALARERDAGPGPLPPPARSRAQAQAAPTPEPEPEPEPSGETPAISLSSLRNAWPDIIRKLKESRVNIPLAAQLEYATVHSVDGRVITLVVGTSAFKTMLEQRQDKLVEIIRKIFRVTMTFHIVLAGATAPRPVDDTIVDDPLIADQLSSGAEISQFEDNQGGMR
ncbi:MAG: DNA polymerase III subunit gamma/tau [Anaerolineae bacterium]|nr:DNA polymerase III subunit gamma/tau [Anaerolineae bacterium]